MAARGQALLDPLRSTVIQGLVGAFHVQAKELSEWLCYLYVRNSPAMPQCVMTFEGLSWEYPFFALLWKIENYKGRPCVIMSML